MCILTEGGGGPTATKTSATSTTILISPLNHRAPLAASFGTGVVYGGPVVCLWGWILACVCSMCVALGMAELASAYPTSGGMYYWWVGRL